MHAATSSKEKSPWFGKPLVSGKIPRKKNLCEEAINATGSLELVPVFPYLDNGSIVACLSVSTGGVGTRELQFFHENEVGEVLLCLSAYNAPIASGQMLLLPERHGVNNYVKDLNDESAYVLLLVIIRMSQAETQREGFLLRCGNCNERLLERHADIKQGPKRPHYPEFHAIGFYADAVDEFNASERTCPKCGQVQEPFPAEQVGWRRYAKQIDVANRARSAAEEMAARCQEKMSR